MYGVPKDKDNIFLVYNKEMFDAAGVAYPDDSWTWDDLVDASQNIHYATGNYGYLAYLDYQLGYWSYVYQNGGYILNAGKTASDGTDRYIWGWCASRAGLSNTGAADWAGNLVAHRLIQNPDGTLTTAKVEAIYSRFKSSETFDGFNLSAAASKLMPRLGTANSISFTVTTSSATDCFGMSFARGSDSEKWYSVIVNPESDTVRKINFEEEGGQGFIPDTDGYIFDAPADGVYNISIVTDNSVVSVYINDTAAWTGRIYCTARNCWSINSYGCEIAVSDIVVKTI